MVSVVVAAVLFVALHCVLISDAGFRVTEAARVQYQVASCWSGYDNFLQVVLRTEVVADSSSDVQISVALLSVIAIQVEGVAVLRPVFAGDSISDVHASRLSSHQCQNPHALASDAL